VTAAGGTAGTKDWSDPKLPGYTLAWSDEFDVQGAPNSENWHILEWDAGATNKELQKYTADPKNVRVENGMLVINALLINEKDAKYSSARVFGSGKRDITYGRIDVRAKLPKGRGTWPAIWMMPTSPVRYGDWPNSGEIDIMEHVGFEPDAVHSAVHTETYNWLKKTQKTSKLAVPGVANEFHVFRLDWSATMITTFVDDVRVFSFENPGSGPKAWPFDQPFHMILNIAIGGEWGGAQGIDDSIFPQQMLVDFVRVYKPHG
jgi:beta-glucanase (GH16 family)